MFVVDGNEAFLLCSVAVLGVIFNHLSRIAWQEFLMLLPQRMQERVSGGGRLGELPPPAAVKKLGKVLLLLVLTILAKIWFVVLVSKESQPVATAIVVMFTFNLVVGLALRKAHSPSPPVGR